MKQYTITHLSASDGKENIPFWQPWSLWGWIWRSLLFLLALLLFLFLFCLPQSGRRPVVPNPVLPPDTTIVTPGGDTLRGQNPGLFNPDNPRGPREQDPNPDSPGWPANIGDDRRHPALPNPEDNKIPPSDSGKVRTDPRTGKKIDNEHLLVVLNSDEGDEVFNRFASQLSALYSEDDCSIVYYNTLTKVIVLHVKESLRDSIMQNLPSQITDIDFYICDINVLGDSALYPNDPAFQSSRMVWHYDAVQAYQAWEITKGSPDVIVAVVDSYFELSHPDLRAAKVIFPYSISNQNSDVYPSSSAQVGSLIHGTHVAGIISGTMGNREGACGIAPGCSLLPVSLGENLTTASLIEGILYAVYKGASVINVSIGLAIDESIARRLSISDQIAYARESNLEQEQLWNYIFQLCNQRNITIVWAAGNSNLLSLMDNSKRDSTTVKVEAVDRNLKKAGFSNFGNIPQRGIQASTVSAPGCEILSTIPYGDYYSLDGTSMAAPIVTAAVALMKSLDASMTNAEVIQILKETARPLGEETIGDLLQIRSALDAVKSRMLKFEDVMQNHDLLVGRWQATRYLGVNDSDEQTQTYLTFDTTSSGTKEKVFVYGRRTGERCKGRVSVTFRRDDILIRDLDNPRSPEGSSFVKSAYYCVPDSLGLLRVQCTQDNVEELLYFHLKKIE